MNIWNSQGIKTLCFSLNIKFYWMVSIKNIKPNFIETDLRKCQRNFSIV